MYDAMLPTERIGRATWLLAQGRSMTVRELAETLEMTTSGASKLLDRLSRVLPLVVEDGDNGGVWRIKSGEDERGEMA